MYKWKILLCAAEKIQKEKSEQKKINQYFQFSLKKTPQLQKPLPESAQMSRDAEFWQDWLCAVSRVVTKMAD